MGNNNSDQLWNKSIDEVWNTVQVTKVTVKELNRNNLTLKNACCMKHYKSSENDRNCDNQYFNSLWGYRHFWSTIKFHRKILPHYSMAGVMTRDGNNGTITLTEKGNPKVHYRLSQKDNKKN
jgi:hypothetical protein